MVAKRIIPCLDVKDSRTVKGVNFVGLRDAGDAVELGHRYSLEGADELVYLDISATQEGRSTFCSLVEKIALTINIPFTVGGGISTLEDAARLLDAGADKISLNSAAIRNPQLISDIASKYGSQFVVIAIDARQIDGRWMATTQFQPTKNYYLGLMKPRNEVLVSCCLHQWIMMVQKQAIPWLHIRP